MRDQTVGKSQRWPLRAAGERQPVGAVAYGEVVGGAVVGGTVVVVVVVVVDVVSGGASSARWIAVPRGTSIPSSSASPLADAATTKPAASPTTSPTTNPASVIAAVASTSVSPISFGTGTGSGPFETAS